MTKRIAIGNGSYCYAGPNCRLHSATGITAARALRDEAAAQFARAKTLDEMEKAQDALKKASAAFDATTDGRASLARELASTKDELVAVGIRMRMKAAEEYETEVEQAAAEKPAVKKAPAKRDKNALLNKIDMMDAAAAEAWEKKHEVGVTAIAGGGYGGHAWRGRKADGIYGAKAAKAGVVELIKQAQKDGYLPADAQIRVTAPRYEAMSVTVVGYSDQATLVRDKYDDAHSSVQAAELEQRLDNIVNTFNYDDSNSQVDYFNRGFYADVKVETERDREWRVKEAARAKESRETNKVAAAAKEEFRTGAAGEASLRARSVQVSTPAEDGSRIHVIPDSKVYMLLDKDEKVVDIYNMGGYTINNLEGRTEQEAMADTLLASRSRFQGRRLLNQRSVFR